MEFSFENPSSSNQPNSIASDRLRKAIERNRRKQARRGAEPLKASSARATPRGRRSQEVEGNVFGESWAPPRSKRATPATTQTRRSVAKANTASFVTEARQPVRKAPAKVAYTRRKTSAKKSAAVTQAKDYLIKGVWIFCGFLALRLIFSTGGVVDYYSRTEALEARIREYNSVLEDNKKTAEEIEKMRSHAGFQKRLVREHLGFIAPDEYLILFPKNAEKKSI